jgi:hypothetical protein
MLEGTHTEQLDEPIKEVSSKEEGDEQCSPKSDLPGTKEKCARNKEKDDRTSKSNEVNKD